MPNQRRASDIQQPEIYEIRVRGPLGPALLEAFPDLAAHRRGQDTILRGPLPDQCALYGVIHQLDALRLELLEVRRRTADGARRRGR
jgi:monoterpene epsilon-lactone hydrolase